MFAKASGHLEVKHLGSFPFDCNEYIDDHLTFTTACRSYDEGCIECMLFVRFSKAPKYMFCNAPLMNLLCYTLAIVNCHSSFI